MEEMEKPEFDLVAVTQTTAKNMYELMLTLAAQLRKLEMVLTLTYPTARL